ncbi:MAG: DUF1540 domain-containing protein [Oligoflexia bacterium]|nr:DUF1540 domain-containing protein [Oligoflexia bacterium]
MPKVTLEMPPVAKCSVDSCAYNVSQKCHAKAITVGDGQSPGCDTFFTANAHSREKQRIAGVGACKVSGCRFNDDFECNAGAIEVGRTGSDVRCLSFSPRQTP